MRLLGAGVAALGVAAYAEGRIELFGAAVCVFCGAALIAIGGRR